MSADITVRGTERPCALAADGLGCHCMLHITGLLSELLLLVCAVLVFLLMDLIASSSVSHPACQSSVISMPIQLRAWSTGATAKTVCLLLQRW